MKVGIILYQTREVLILSSEQYIIHKEVFGDRQQTPLIPEVQLRFILKIIRYKNLYSQFEFLTFSIYIFMEYSLTIKYRRKTHKFSLKTARACI